MRAVLAGTHVARTERQESHSYACCELCSVTCYNIHICIGICICVPYTPDLTAATTPTAASTGGGQASSAAQVSVASDGSSPLEELLGSYYAKLTDETQALYEQARKGTPNVKQKKFWDTFTKAVKREALLCDKQVSQMVATHGQHGIVPTTLGDVIVSMVKDVLSTGWSHFSDVEVDSRDVLAFVGKLDMQDMFEGVARTIVQDEGLRTVASTAIGQYFRESFAADCARYFPEAEGSSPAFDDVEELQRPIKFIKEHMQLEGGAQKAIHVWDDVNAFDWTSYHKFRRDMEVGVYGSSGWKQAAKGGHQDLMNRLGGCALHDYFFCEDMGAAVVARDEQHACVRGNVPVAKRSLHLVKRHSCVYMCLCLFILVSSVAVMVDSCYGQRRCRRTRPYIAKYTAH